MISVVRDPALQYPNAASFFSPDEKFPEYAFDDVARSANPVYRAVRELLRQAGLDPADFGRPGWNPLGKWIRKGQTVFVLCNFVYHRRAKEPISHFQSKCTQAAVIRPIIDYVLKAVGPGGRVRFGNAPLQSCDWSRVLAQTGGAQMEFFY